MKPIIRILTPAMAGLVLMAAAQADDLAAFKKWYTAGAPMMKKAMETKDLAFFEKAAGPNFTYKSMGQTQDRKTALAGLKSMFDMTEKLTYTFKINGFKKTKAGFAVTLTNKYVMTTKPGPDKKHHVMTMEQKSVENWVKAGKDYALSGIEDIGTAKATQDGKKMDPTKMGGG